MQPSIWGFSGTWPRVSGWPDTHSESARQAEQALGRSLRSLSRAAGQAFSPAAVRARLNFSTYWTLISLPQNLKAHKTLLRVSYLTSACFKVCHLTTAFRFILLRSRKQPFFLIVKPIFCQNTCKMGVLTSYDQEICRFIDRNQSR